METWTKTCGPIPSGSILTHTRTMALGALITLIAVGVVIHPVLPHVLHGPVLNVIPEMHCVKNAAISVRVVYFKKHPPVTLTFEDKKSVLNCSII